MSMSVDTTTLEAFIASNRAELLRRCRAKVGRPVTAAATEAEIERGISAFIGHLISELSGESKGPQIGDSAIQHGADMFREGATIGQVVHDYGAICQSVTDLAVETQAPVTVAEFRTLNRCLDDAIASAVSEYARHSQRDLDSLRSLNRSLTFQNLVEGALLGFEAIQAGTVGVGGTTGELVRRSLTALRALSAGELPPAPDP